MDPAVALVTEGSWDYFAVIAFAVAFVFAVG
jgi:hypothetical protein